MARNFQRRTFTRASQRRKTDWLGGVQTLPTNETTLNGQTAAIISSFDTRAVGAIQAPFTVVRVRGILVVSPQAITIEQFIIGAYGICLVNGEAFDAGVASIVTPWSESNDDRWLYHTYFSTQNKLGAADNTVGFVTQTIMIDGRGQRKVEVGDVLVTVIENASSDNMTFLENYRTLLKLH